jgi:glucose-1-phosphate thymidylyltransferase
MKGILLAGGAGTRLDPLTKITSKQLLPVYDKPMIYYPLSTLMMAGIKEILIISCPRDLTSFKELLGDGSQWGIKLFYAVQEKPQGIAQAIQIAEPFFQNESVCLILGDNIFYGEGFPHMLQTAAKDVNGAIIFTYHVTDPERYGVAEIDASGNVTDIEEKPAKPKSNYAVAGLYLYGPEVFKLAKDLKPSPRGELEITDLNKEFLKNKKLKAVMFGRGYAWLDTGTHESLLEASQFIAILEKRQGVKIACIEEVAYRFGFITKAQFSVLVRESQSKSSYYEYLRRLDQHGL